MTDKDKSYFAKIILASVAFIAFLTVLGLMAELVKNKAVINREPQVSVPTITPVFKDETADWKTYQFSRFCFKSL